MNFQHIVKRKTKLATISINAINGYRAVEIFNPMEVVENEKVNAFALENRENA